MNLKIITTSDGSHSLYRADLDEHYHSIHGAVQESRHVFINAGFRAMHGTGSLRILEVGLRTGLNALLTLLETTVTSCDVYYTALEPFPLPGETIARLNYPGVTGPGLSTAYNEIHSAPWEQDTAIGDHFVLRKVNARLEVFNDVGYDLVYFDAFGPEVQPELWVQEIFGRMFAALRPGGILVTYCAKGQVKRNMKAAGFVVETLPGPPGKREMVRCKKPG